MRCIYCLEEKPDAAFKGREHVMPQAFGRIETNNLVLKCVCDACNNYFSHYIDRKLARDSAEAIDRVTKGLKSARDFESMGRRSTSFVEFQMGGSGPRKGYHVPSRDSDEVLGVMALPQVLFFKADDTEPDVFLKEECPTKDELVAMGYERGSRLLIQTWEIDDPWGFLATKGFNMDGMEKGHAPPPEGRVRIENVTLLAEPDYRAVTKIALNYLAAVVGHETARLPAFDDARNFARYGSERARVKVIPYENPHFVGRRGHYASIRRDSAGWVIAQLSILMRTQYFVVLSKTGAEAYFYSTAHLWDLDANRVKDIEPLTYTTGRPLKKVSADEAARRLGSRNPPPTLSP